MGIAVECVAHLVHGFESASGNRDERMDAALKDIFAPVFQGVISSFLGFSGMAFSDYDYSK